MMTPDEELELLRKIDKEIRRDAEAVFAAVMVAISNGKAPRDAVRDELARFNRVYAEKVAEAFNDVAQTAMGTAGALEYQVGDISLSQRLYSQAEKTSAEVQNIVTKHTRGFQNAKTLALELYEGYGFRDEEVLRISTGNNRLPNYLLDLLRDDPRLLSDFKRVFTRSKVQALKTGALRAAYLELLDEIDNIEKSNGFKNLEKKLKVALEEKTRYYANRIAQTELHRAYAQRQALELLADSDVQYVQYRLSPTHPIEDICDYFAGVNRYGLGAGVYPKALAPVAPAHPFCKCVLSPRLDLNGKRIKDNQKADQTFFSRLSIDERRKVAGSRKKADRVAQGGSMWDIHNENTLPVYQVKRVGEISGADT